MPYLTAMQVTHVLYNDRCPICRAEIAQYARYADALGAPLVFEDLHAAPLAQWDLTPDQAKRRLHARLPDGRHVSGIDAFAAIWDHLPRMRWLARSVRLPVIGALTRVAYDHLAAPALYTLHKRRERLGNANPHP
ncbi:thiol-disulfide oxidoreductase DCC family protein [Jannaschia sp. CCS1]|uniref:thiol-disulfide oxidoreductase DCC family protein n=1 Tax=Jannaschia sp. (strain CCS1) TaxID=290400 RepID=UPI0002FCCFDF|nr:DUF393 domain-containing protein [Jannaschia sp. CCS1]